MSDYPAHIIARFWSKVEKSTDPDGCWLWRGAVTSRGSGSFGVPGKHGTKSRKSFCIMAAHRFAYEVQYGPIPHDMWVLHTPPCVNRVCVKHLYLGTRQENVDDMVSLGRNDIARGSACAQTKYTEMTVQAILDE